MRLLVLLISVAGLMALVFFGLSVLLINIVGWLWPANSSSRLDRVIMIAGARQTRKQKEKAGKVS
jgi:hypothetical protein